MLWSVSNVYVLSLFLLSSKWMMHTLKFQNTGHDSKNFMKSSKRNVEKVKLASKRKSLFWNAPEDRQNSYDRCFYWQFESKALHRSRALNSPIRFSFSSNSFVYLLLTLQRFMNTIIIWNVEEYFFFTFLPFSIISKILKRFSTM